MGKKREEKENEKNEMKFLKQEFKKQKAKIDNDEILEDNDQQILYSPTQIKQNFIMQDENQDPLKKNDMHQKMQCTQPPLLKFRNEVLQESNYNQSQDINIQIPINSALSLDQNLPDLSHQYDPTDIPFNISSESSESSHDEEALKNQQIYGVYNLQMNDKKRSKSQKNSQIVEEQKQKEKQDQLYDQLEQLNKLKLDQLDIFEEVDVFRAGTFKFEKNKNYIDDINKIEKSLGIEFDNTHKKEYALWTRELYTIEKDHFIEKKQKERKLNVKYFKTFVPIFPFLYQQIQRGLDLGQRKFLSLYGQKVYIKQKSKKQTSNIQLDMDLELIHKRAQIKFSLNNDRLYKYEESRQYKLDSIQQKAGYSQYLINIDFENVKNVWIWKEQPNTQELHSKYQQYLKKDSKNSEEQFLKNFTVLTILIQFKKPCSTMKFIQEDESDEISSCEELEEEIQKKINEKIKWNKNSKSKVENNQESQNNQKINSDEKKQKNKKKIFPKFVRSPFNMTSNLEEDIRHESYKIHNQRQKDEFTQFNYDTLINYWNNNQVIHMAGLASQQNLEIFIKTLEKSNPKAKIHQNVGQMLNMMFLNKEDMNQELLSLRQKGIQFSDQLNLMRPTLRFSIMALLSQNKFNIFNQGLIDFMAMLTNGGWNKNEMTSDFGAYIIDHINLFKDLDYKDDSSAEIEELFTALKDDRQILEDFKKSIDSKNLIRQRRVLVTPTLFNFTVAREEEGNKVLRQYKQHLSQFIRLSFVNEELDKGFYFTYIFEPILGYIHSILKRGFFIGRSLRVKFLSYSNSQLKNHTFWFLSDIDNSIDEKQIIDAMGCFDNEKNILKRFARRGQCFSTTQNFQILQKDEIYVGYPDTQRNGYVFSDGCGWIEPSFAQKIANQFKYLQVSAFQIRLGGAKGILAVNNDIQAFKKDQDSDEFEYIEVNDQNVYKILLRDSQIKFQSENFSLDIIRCATFSQGYLNRQIIILLHCLGVPVEFFLKKQQVAKQFCQLDFLIKRIEEKIQKINKKYGNFLEQDAELQFLNDKETIYKKNRRILDLSKDIKLAIEPCKSFQGILKQSFLKGLNLMNDPVTSSILNCMQLNQLMNLKKKARILLPDSCVLIGIIDPTGILEPDQIFVQIRKDSFSYAKNGYERQNQNGLKQSDILNEIQSISQIIEGDVLVTRNPCTHPGDIRYLHCVNRPHLQHLFNVVVFSSKGKRPVCNMMSGGDLDGDVYFVTWDKELLSYVKPNHIQLPADYTKSQLIKDQPKGDQIADFIIFYMQRDVLGIVSNLWLLVSDLLGKDGPKKDICIKLSEMCSVAVDFAKHGECVSKKNFVKIQKTFSQKYPDFLERDSFFGLKTYVSDGVLGYLYRDLGIKESLDQFMRNEWKNSICLDYQLESQILDLIYEDEDIKMMHSYLQQCFENIVQPMTFFLKKHMMQFQLACESELFSCDLRFRVCHSAEIDEKSFYIGDPGSQNDDAVKNLNQIRRNITDKYKLVFEQIVDKAKLSDQNAQLHASIALYLATYFDSNPSGTKYWQRYQNDENFKNFFQSWVNFAKQNQFSPSNKNHLKFQKFQQKIRNNFDFFKYICIEAEQGNSQKMRKLQQIKKLFCIPWLIAGETLLCYYPDQYKSIKDKMLLKRQKKLNQIHKHDLQKLSREDKLKHIFNMDKDSKIQETQKQSFIQMIGDAHQKFHNMQLLEREK